MLCINTAGKGGQDEIRAHRLAATLPADITHFDVDRTISRLASSHLIWNLLKSTKWNLVYQEGSSIASGVSLIRAALSWGQPFVVSCGDPIGGFMHVTKGPILGYTFDLYEHLLYRTCAGFVGWTPYLTGRALTWGAKRAATVEGAVDTSIFYPYAEAERGVLKQKFGLNPSHLVCGVVGSLKWTPRQAYVYGLELVEMLKLVKRLDISVLIVGDGDGRVLLEKRIPDHLKSRIIFTGRLPQAEVVAALNAMDIGFITQTLDQLGNYRLTTKLPEYLACGLPVAMSPIPGFYDYVSKAGWSLAAFHPASAEFQQSCANWLDNLSWSEVQAKATNARGIATENFDYNLMSERFREFVQTLF